MRWRGLALAAMLMPGAVLAQEGDPGILTRFLQDNLSSAGRTVTITGFQGALSSRATVERMTIADAEGVWLTLNGVTLDWNRAAVLRREFSVNELSVREVILERPPLPEPGLPAPEAKGFALPELPISIDIGRVAAERVEIGAAVLGQPVEATLDAAMRLANGEGQARLTLLRLDEGRDGRITLDASYANTSRLLVLDLDAREGPGGIAATRLGLPGAPAAALQVKGQGIIDNFAADVRLATDGVDRLSGRVTLAEEEGGGRRFAAVLGGNPAPLFLPDYAAFFGEEVRLDVAGVRDASGALDLERLSVRTQALQIDGSLRTGPEGVPNRFALDGRIAQPDGAPVVLPLSGPPTRIGRAEVALSYDATQDEGWSGRASLQDLSRDGIDVGQVLLTGSGRIRDGAGGTVAGATLRLLAAGLRPADPGLAEALGAAVTGQMRLVWQDGQPVTVSDLTLAGADYTVTTRGRITGLASGIGLDGRVTADLADLARFSGLAGRPLAGRAALEAQGRGSLLGGDLDLEGTLRGEGLRIGQAQADALLAAPSRIAFSVARGAEGTEIRRLDVTAASLAVGLTGWLRSAGSDLAAELRFDDLSVLGGGWRGRLAGQARLKGTPEAGQLALDATAEGLALGEARVDRLLRGTSALSAELRRVDGAVKIDRLRLENPQLSLRATGEGPGGGRRLDVAAKLADLGLLIPEFPGPLTLAGSATDGPEGYQVDLRAKGPGQIDATVAGTVAPRGERVALSIAGTAQAALANPFITPRTVGGPLRFDLKMAGPPGLSALTGRVSLSNGRVAAPFLGISLRDVGAEATLAKGVATISADARAAAGGGLGLRGTLGLAPPFEANLTVTPRGMVLRDPELYETRADGEIRIQGPIAGGARISGAITLPETEIRVPSTGIGGAAAIPDLVHQDEPAAVRATRERAGLIERERERARAQPRRPYALDLEIRAPNRMFLRGRGLDAELGGTLRIGGTTDAVVPSGGIDLIRGRLDILRRRLELTEAQLRLEGSLDPTIRVVAANSSEGITSSVTIEGRITQPEITFASVPELPQEEVLAHLLFGRNLTSLSPLQAVELANAVATLAGRSGEGLIGRLRRSFGLDDVDLGADGSGGTAVRLGRYISDNLYTDVTVGSDGETQLNLNLDVGRGVTVRGTADSEGNTGFGAFLERDY